MASNSAESPKQTAANEQVDPDTVKSTRVTADFDPEAYAALSELADLLHTSKADAIRRALGLSRYVLRQKKSGKRLIIEDEKGNNRTEVVTL